MYTCIPSNQTWITPRFNSEPGLQGCYDDCYVNWFFFKLQNEILIELQRVLILDLKNFTTQISEIIF